MKFRKFLKRIVRAVNAAYGESRRPGLRDLETVVDRLAERVSALERWDSSCATALTTIEKRVEILERRAAPTETPRGGVLDGDGGRIVGPGFDSEDSSTAGGVLGSGTIPTIEEAEAVRCDVCSSLVHVSVLESHACRCEHCDVVVAREFLRNTQLRHSSCTESDWEFRRGWKWVCGACARAYSS